MNKLFKKIVGAALGLTMAIGVGVAVASNSEAVPAHAASYQWQKMTSTSEFVDGTTILITQSSYYLDASQAATGNTPKMANLTLSSGLPTLTANNSCCLTVSGSGSSIKLVKSTDTSKYLYTNTSNNATRIGNASTNGQYWTIENGPASGEFYLKSNASTARYLSRYQTTDFRSYTNTGTNANLVLYKLVEAKTTQTITVDPSSKEAYTDETISLTTNATTATWSLSNNTCVASLSANTGKNVYVSATSAGSVKVTAAATSTHTEASVTLTFSERPTTPFITPAKSSTSGYTGMDETISVTYGNLTSGLAVSSNNTSVVDASIDYDDEDGNADILLDFNGAGSTTVSLKDGSTQLATISVSVTASNVTITGLPSTGKAFIGNTLDLGATITVTATGSMSKSVTWSSTTTSVATVSSTGIVTGVKKGTSVITVTSVSKPSVSMSCTVSVEEQAVYTLVTDPSTLADGTQFVLVDYVSSTYRIAKDLNSGHIKMNTVTSATTISGTTSGSTVATDEADVFTLVGSSGAWEIMRGDTYLQFTGTSNGNDSFTNTSSADTKFSIVTSSTSNKLTINSNSCSNRALRYNTSTGDLRNYVNTGSQLDLYMYAIIPAQNELDHVTTSGQTTSFTAGNTFSYGGTLTAYYTSDDPATKTPTSFKLDSESGATITTSTVLTKAAHDGHEIYVLYTEDNITKSAHYTITVNYAAVTSVVIDTHEAGIGLGETYNVTSVGVTINTEYANQGYEWLVSANTVDDEYFFENNELLAGDTPGTITLRCRSTADNSKYDELVVTVTGDPVVDIIPASVSGYVGKSVDVDFTYGNIDNEELIRFASSDESVLTVGEHIEDNGEGVVTINFEGAGNATLSVSYNGGSTLDSITVTVSADSVTALSWSAPTIKVYSGATTTVSDASSWNVHYTMASGDEDNLSYGEYTLKLGGSAITLPHTWDASEDGKVLSIEYGGFASPTTSTVDVTQSLRPVNAPVPGEESTKTWTATAAANFGSTIKNVNDTDSGSVTFNNGSTMSYERTLEFVASGKADYLAFSSNYIQFGSSNALEKLVLTAATSGTVTSVVVNCWAKDGGSNISVTVGGNAFDSSKKCPSAGAEVTFNGSATGTVAITMEKSTKTAGLAQYIKSVAITTTEESGETTNIANVAGYEAAQKAVIDFADDFISNLDDVCVAYGSTDVEDLESVWSALATQYDNWFNKGGKTLSSEEIVRAKALFAHASSDENGDSLQKMLAQYDWIVSHYEGCSDFLNTDAGTGRDPVNTAIRGNSILTVDGNNATAIIVIIVLVSITAIGGYFAIRKRKEQ